MVAKQIKRILLADPIRKKHFGNVLRTVYGMQQVHAQRAARGPKRRGGRRK